MGTILDVLSVDCLTFRLVKVLQNVSGPITLGSKKSDVAIPSGIGYYEYDFLASVTHTSKLPQLEDLQSASASLLINEGMIFWGSDDPQDDNWDLVATEIGDEMSDAMEEDQVAENQTATDTVDANPVPMEETEKEDTHTVSVTDEEKAVEMMLTL